jgi:predicted small lipoprotein YifL
MKRPLLAALALAALVPLAACGSKDGASLANDVIRTLESQRQVTVTEVTCNDFKPAKGVIVNCEGTVNGRPSGIRVTFDDKTHFTVDPQDPGH